MCTVCNANPKVRIEFSIHYVYMYMYIQWSCLLTPLLDGGGDSSKWSSHLQGQQCAYSMCKCCCREMCRSEHVECIGTLHGGCCGGLNMWNA